MLNLLFSVARTATPTLTKVFVRTAVQTAAVATGTIIVAGVARVVKDRYDEHLIQRKALNFQNSKKEPY
jgi:hypothetical protein